MTIEHVGIVGAGAWGTALAIAMRRADLDVTIWAHKQDVVEDINRRHENRALLPGVALDPKIVATGDIASAVTTDLVFLVAPAQHLRAVCQTAAPAWQTGVQAVICAKGIEQGSGALMSSVVAETLPAAEITVLSGPTFAAEVAAGLPTAATLAASDGAFAARLAEAIGSARFRLYYGDDPIGAQVGGALKNVLAIATGVVIGRRLGDNARAALITRGLAEMVRMGTALGGKSATLMGLSGIGDLTLTCTGAQSRNLSLGIALGQGQALTGLLATRRSVAEGVHTAVSVTLLAERLGLDMPICVAINRVLHHGADIDATVEAILSRPFTGEIDHTHRQSTEKK
jgi:glycerol-3-phosphate dehydrogenase (NAD(P)+)